MAEQQLQQVLAQLKSTSPPQSYANARSLLSKAKLLLLKLNALSPASSSASPTAASPQPPSTLALARETYEQGALHSIRARDPDAFTRYVTQLAPFYELPAAVLPPSLPERNKVTGLYLLLLLTQGRYAEFHSELESLSTREGGGGSVDVEGDRFLGYPIRLERWLMEGSYDRVWKAMKSREVPSEEYAVFSEVCPLRVPPFCLSLRRTTPPSLTPSLTTSGPRSSPPKSAPKSPPPASAPTRTCPYPRPNPSSSSTPRAPSSTLPARAAGSSRTA